MKGLLIVFISIVLLSLEVESGCSGVPNSLPIVTTAPTLVRTCTNGKLYRIAGEIDPPLNVLHVYGTPYEMGYAYGECTKDYIQEMAKGFFPYMYSQINQYLEFLPQDIRVLVEEFGVEAALELTALGTEYFTPKHFIDEMHGLADGSGIPYSTVYQIAMLPELIKASCSMFGAWGPAIKYTNGTFYQLRALDWGTSSPFQKYPVVLIYHPNPGNGHPFSVLTWTGLVGAITGYSSAPLGVCEKLWYHYNESSTRLGTPFTFVLRDILQYDVDTASAMTRLSNADRTCSIFVGLGDYTHTFTVAEYAYEEVIFYDWDNFPVYPGHPKMPGLVYIDKHTQPSSDPCFGDLLGQNYGNLNPETIVKNITAVAQTGDMHIAIYDFSKNYMYVANAGIYNATSGIAVPAYDRHFARVDLSAMYAEQL